MLPCISLTSVLLGCSLIPENVFEPSSLREEEDLVVRPLDAVAALGQLSPAGEIRQLAAPLSGFGGTPRVAELFVEEGDLVTAGQTIAAFDNRPQVISDLSVLKARLDTLYLSKLMQEKEILRYQKIALTGATSLVLLEEKKDELFKIEGEIKQVLAERKGLEVDLFNTQLKSPIDGVVLRINARVGERSGNDGVLEVGANNKMQALIEVYESDINRVKVNQLVRLISENGGFEGTLKGFVHKISPQVRQRKVLSTDPTGDADARVVKVTVDLDEESSALVSHLIGMKVIAKFEPI